MYKFKENLIYLTSNTKITQSELARILNCSRQSIFNIINSNDPKLSTISKIAEAYNISEQSLLFDDLSQKGEKL